MKPFLLVLGLLSAALIVGQLVMGQLILRRAHMPPWPKTHEHSDYLTVVVTLIYIACSLFEIFRARRRDQR
jgi:hypothetical protein